MAFGGWGRKRAVVDVHAVHGVAAPNPLWRIPWAEATQKLLAMTAMPDDGGTVAGRRGDESRRGGCPFPENGALNLQPAGGLLFFSLWPLSGYFFSL